MLFVVIDVAEIQGMMTWNRLYMEARKSCGEMSTMKLLRIYIVPELSCLLCG